MQKVKIPSNDTYHVKVVKLPDVKTRRHIVEVEPLIDNKKLVHHMFIFHCEAKADVEFPLIEVDADTWPEKLSACWKTVAFWVS